MILNPYDTQLELANAKVSELDSEYHTIKSEIDWYKSTSIDALTGRRDGLENLHLKQLQINQQLSYEISQHNAAINTVKTSIEDRPWNSKLKERKLSELASQSIKSIEWAQLNLSKGEVTLRGYSGQISAEVEVIEKYIDFNLNMKNKSLSKLFNDRSVQQQEVERISAEKKRMDEGVGHVQTQIDDTKAQIVNATDIIDKARKLDKKLSDNHEAYNRKLVHEECEREFGTGNPKKLILQKESEIASLERTLEKLSNRGKKLVRKVDRTIKKLILDGNNLCYDGNTFIGLEALNSLVPTLAKHYEIVLMFDASICDLLQRKESIIIESFKTKVHIVAPGIKADETILDLAGSEPSSFIVSNDRFAEFGEKPVVKKERVIRHEICSGLIFIHDLNISEKFRNDVC